MCASEATRCGGGDDDDEWRDGDATRELDDDDTVCAPSSWLVVECTLIASAGDAEAATVCASPASGERSTLVVVVVALSGERDRIESTVARVLRGARTDGGVGVGGRRGGDGDDEGSADSDAEARSGDSAPVGDGRDERTFSRGLLVRRAKSPGENQSIA